MKDHESLDYDLWQLQHHLLLYINFTIHWTKIKSHASAKQRKAQGELPSLLNEQVDSWATQAQLLNHNPLAEVIPQVPVTPFIKSISIHGPIRQHFKFQATCGALEEYLCKRNSWSMEVFHTIAWQATKYAIKKFPREKRVHAIKYLHNWQRTGKQIELFSVSAAPGDTPGEPDNGSAYPACGIMEGHSHFFFIQQSTLYTNTYWIPPTYQSNCQNISYFSSCLETHQFYY